jgi:hypothetical protein
VPHRADLADRLPAVLEAVYGAYAIDWQHGPHGAPIESLTVEALQPAWCRPNRADHGHAGVAEYLGERLAALAG